MLTYIARRILYSIPVLLVASFLTFWRRADRVRPAGEVPARARTRRSVIPQQRKRLGLDHPLVVQWWNWLTKASRGDLGISERTNNEVLGELIHRLWHDDPAASSGARCSRLRIAIGIGVYSAVKQYSVGDYAVHRPVLRRLRDAAVLVRA